MPQTLGVAMPVYGQCKEAKLIDRLEDKEETELYRMFALVRHLAVPAKTNSFLKALEQMNVQKDMLQEVEKIFSDQKQQTKRDGQEARAMLVMADSHAVAIDCGY